MFVRFLSLWILSNAVRPSWRGISRNHLRDSQRSLGGGRFRSTYPDYEREYQC